MTRTGTLIVSNSTDAQFRAWAQEVHDALTAFGWVNTADTGQINLTTVVKPAGTSTSQGYEIWRMADALQATNAVFMKIEYGSGTGSANNPGIWITLGTGSNGSGTLTGAGTRTLITQCNSFTTSPKTFYSSGSTNRFCMALGADASDNNSILYFGVERTKNADGTDSTEGMIMVGYGNDQGAGFCKFNMQAVPFTGSIPAVETMGTGDFPTNTTQTSAIVGADSYTFMMRPILYYPRNPMMNWLVYYNADFTREVATTVEVYSANHTYMPLGSNGQAGGSSHFTQSVRTVARMMMRYE